MENDLHSNVQAAVAMDTQAIASDTTTVGNIIDTQGFESIEFIGLSKTITDGTYTLKLEDGDDSGLSDAADVDSTLLLGTLFAFAAADDDAVLRTGCIAKKRYVRASIVSASTTTGVDMMSVVAVQGHPKTAPVAEQV